MSQSSPGGTGAPVTSTPVEILTPQIRAEISELAISGQESLLAILAYFDRRLRFIEQALEIEYEDDDLEAPQEIELLEE